MNRLANESSLYLRQHAGNPVDWYPWGDEAIQCARDLDRPIFLSIGYSACHWCHVMEHESFQDASIAKFLNEHFVPIKVDREERPDIDHLYMSALQLMTREGGGWPLSVWLTPDLHPFYAGTYFPPDDRYSPQRPSFGKLLAAIADAWRGRRQEIVDQSGNVAGYLREMEQATPPQRLSLTLGVLDNAARVLCRGFDSINGGIGQAPKFPHALELRFLLRQWARTGDGTLLHVVRHSLDKMAVGGICDQIGGGFHRYSTDARWLVPHFEKMLYDNALLASVYVDAWQATGEPEYQRVATETLDYVLREMTSPQGAFFSSQDADSEGEEGRFYVWSPSEIEQVLDVEESRLVNYVFDVTDEGNFEGKNILHREKTWEQLAKLLQRPEAEIRARLKAVSAKLYEARSKRAWPGRDEKVLTSWNGLMITAFANAGAAFGESRFSDAAVKCAEFILSRMIVDGTLHRTCAMGAPPRIPGYLEDYACLIDALTELYAATFAPGWLEQALRLAEGMLARFKDPAGGGFFSTAADHRHLIARAKENYDGSTPSGNAMAVTGILKLARLTGRDDLRRHGEAALHASGELMHKAPGGAAQMLTALDFHLGPVTEIFIVGKRDAEDTRQAMGTIRRSYVPNMIVLFRDPADRLPPNALLPLLSGKTGGPEVLTYICEGQTCLEPIKGADEFRRWIAERSGLSNP
jgi:uncharacterized protein YyaL (SSP411 family)